MIELINLDHWVGEIKDFCPIFNTVLETIIMSYDNLDFYETPMALIYMVGDNSKPNPLMNSISQYNKNEVCVEIAIRSTVNQNDRLNNYDSKLIKECRLQVLNALIGWTPLDCDAPVEHSTGELLIKDNFIIWKDTFTTSNYLTQP